jgi:hypothetical protein
MRFRRKTTPIELLLDWLSTMPPLVTKQDVVKRVMKMKETETKHLVSAYQEGYDAYSHPKNYTVSASEWYSHRYRRVEERGYRKQKPHHKIVKNVKPIKSKSVRKGDLH